MSFYNFIIIEGKPFVLANQEKAFFVTSKAFVQFKKKKRKKKYIYIYILGSKNNFEKI